MDAGEMKIYLEDSPTSMYVRTSIISNQRQNVTTTTTRYPQQPSKIECDALTVRQNIAQIQMRNGTTYYTNGEYVYEAGGHCKNFQLMTVVQFLGKLCV